MQNSFKKNIKSEKRIVIELVNSLAKAKPCTVKVSLNNGYCKSYRMY